MGFKFLSFFLLAVVSQALYLERNEVATGTGAGSGTGTPSQITNTTMGSPVVTNWGDWGDWDYCPQGQYVIGMQLKTEHYQGAFSDDSGLNGIKFYCDAIGSNNTELHEISSKVGESGEFGNQYFCNGAANGFQLMSEKDLGWANDDTAASNLRLFCDGKAKEGDGVAWGSWTTEQKCDPKLAICGLRTQVENPNSDDTSLNNLQVLCCAVPDPSEFCKPIDKWDLIIECDNLEASSPTTCTYERKIGTSHWNMMSESNTVLHEVYAHLGFTIPGALTNLPGNFDANLGYSMSTQYNWTQSSGEVWMEETTITVTLEVPPGIRTQLYQTLGTCDFYAIRANKLKRVDQEVRTKTETVTFLSF